MIETINDRKVNLKEEYESNDRINMAIVYFDKKKKEIYKIVL